MQAWSLRTPQGPQQAWKNQVSVNLWNRRELAQRLLLESYVIPQRIRYFEREFLPAAQVGTPEIVATAVQVDEAGLVLSATLTNNNAIAVDVSGRTFTEIWARMPAGVVVPAGATISVVFDRVPIGPQATPQLVVMATRVEPV